MYYGYSIISGRERSNYIKGGEYTGVVNSFPERASKETGNFMILRNHHKRTRINEIDDLLLAANEEYISLSRSIITASDAVKDYVKVRIDELRRMLESLQTERKLLISEKC